MSVYTADSCTLGKSKLLSSVFLLIFLSCTHKMTNLESHLVAVLANGFFSEGGSCLLDIKIVMEL